MKYKKILLIVLLTTMAAGYSLSLDNERAIYSVKHLSTTK